MTYSILEFASSRSSRYRTCTSWKCSPEDYIQEFHLTLLRTFGAAYEDWIARLDPLTATYTLVKAATNADYAVRGREAKRIQRNQPSEFTNCLESASVVGNFDTCDLALDLQQAVGTLTQQQCAVFKLEYLGMTGREIAAKLGVDPRRVSELRSSLHLHLRSHMALYEN